MPPNCLIMDWKEVIGQKEVGERLRRMAQEGRVPHALLLCGPKGCGKMAVAMAFASYLVSGEWQLKDDDFMMDTSGIARNKAMLAQWGHPDLHFSYPTIKLPSMSAEHQPVSDDFSRQWHELIMGGPYFTLEQWMEAMKAENQQAIITAAESDELSRKLSLKSSQGGYKVAVVWLPERMNLASANKILKLLEEPPQQTVFIMVSEEPEKLLETIRSRTQRIEMKRLTEEDIREALTQRRGLDEEVAQRVARMANGSWLRALETLDAGNENRGFHDMFAMLMRLSYMRNVAELKKWSEAVASYGREKQRRMLLYFQQQVRENFMYNFHQPELNYMTIEEENFSKKFAPFINEANVIGISELFERAYRDIGQNANGKIVFYDLALKMIVLLINHG